MRIDLANALTSRGYLVCPTQSAFIPTSSSASPLAPARPTPLRGVPNLDPGCSVRSCRCSSA